MFLVNCDISRPILLLCFSLNPFKTFLVSARHMKIHEKDPASGLLPVSPPSPTKRRRPSIKRRQEEDYEEPPTKKVKMKSHANEKCGFQIWTCWKNQGLLRTFWGFCSFREFGFYCLLTVHVYRQAMEDAATVEEVVSLGVHGAEEELLPCPICFKTCNSRLELDAHMDTHPDTALRCTQTHTHLISPEFFSVLLFTTN